MKLIIENIGKLCIDVSPLRNCASASIRNALVCVRAGIALRVCVRLMHRCFYTP